MRNMLLILCLMLPTISGAEIYKWTDADGQVHYGEKPVGPQSREVRIDTAPGAAPPDQRRRLENIKRWNAARQRERQQAREREAKRKAEEARREKHCGKLRNQLADLERGGVNWYELDAQGERRYMSEQEVASRTVKLRQRVKQACR